MVRYGVFIGRFQPFHNGHLRIVNLALHECDRALVVIAHTNSSQVELQRTRYPISVDARRQMITNSILPDMLSRLSIGTIYNRDDWVAWCGDLDRILRQSASSNGDVDPTFILYGCCKDRSTSDYLAFILQHSRCLKTSRFIDPIQDGQGRVIHGSDIRRDIQHIANVPIATRGLVYGWCYPGTTVRDDCG